MNILTMYTGKYSKEMEKFFSEETIIESGESLGTKFIKVENNLDIRTALQNLIEHIILCDNPAVAYSEKVFNSIAELAFQPTRSIMKIALCEFLQDNKVINIDGYIRFRLQEYSERINSILYSIIKKNLYKL